MESGMCFVCAQSVLRGTGVLGGDIGADAPSKMPIFCSAGVDGPSGGKQGCHNGVWRGKCGTNPLLSMQLPLFLCLFI